MQQDQKIITLIFLLFFSLAIVILASLEVRIEASTMAGNSSFSAPATSSGRNKQCQAFSPYEWRSYYTYSSLAAKTKPIKFPYFSQKDYRYSATAYGYSDKNATQEATVGSSGCGVTAAAMVLRYRGICTDPQQIAKYSLNNGHRYNGQGTSATLFQALAKKYGLRYASTGLNGETKDQKWDFVFSWALKGYPIIASVHNHTFTNDNHYIVIIGMDMNGNMIIADPNSERDTRRATFNEIKSWVNHAHVIY